MQLPTITQNQEDKFQVLDRNIWSVSPQLCYSINMSSIEGLNLALRVGNYVDSKGSINTFIAPTIVLRANQRHFIQIGPTETIIVDYFDWLPGHSPLYVIDTGDFAITNITTVKSIWRPKKGYKEIAIATNYTLTHDDFRCPQLAFTGTLSSEAIITFPRATAEFVIHNKTVGGYSLRCKTNSAISVTIASNKRAVIMCDGTSIFRVSADL